MRNALAMMFLLLTWTTATAGLPDVVPAITDEFVEGEGPFTLYKSMDESDKTLYVAPKNLKVAMKDGKPKVTAVLVRDIIDKKVGADNSMAFGYLAVSLTIGYEDNRPVFSAIKKQLQKKDSPYKDYQLATLPLRPGTGQVGVKLINPKDPATLNSPVIWMPYGVSTTVGAEITVTVPVVKEHAEIIRQLLLAEKGSAARLGINIQYRANATFAVKPFELIVEATAEKTYKYFHERFKASGGFWCFSWHTEREKIREEMNKNQTMKSTIRFNDPANQALLEQKYKILDVLKRYEDEAINYLADIEVDKTGRVPDNSYEKREGRVTIFSPHFFWSYTVWAGVGYGITDIERKSRANYNRKLSVEQAIEREISMELQDVNLPSEVFQLIDLGNAAYVVDTFTVNPFLDSDESLFEKNWVTSASIIVTVPAENGQKENLRFDFNRKTPDAKTRPFFRNAIPTIKEVGEKDESGKELQKRRVLTFDLPDAKITGEVKLQGLTL
jgi:hypothetical protein